jgi:precorrin-3B methylase
MPTREQIEVKYDEQIDRIDDQIRDKKVEIARLQKQKESFETRKERELMRIEGVVDEEAQGTVTTTSVGDAAVVGGQANYAPHMGTMSRHGGFQKAPKSHKKKEKKKDKKADWKSFVKGYYEK